MTQLARIVATAGAVAATSKRTEKRAALAELLAALGPEEIPTVVGFLTGELRQGRIGIGWSAIRDLDARPAASPELTVADVDVAVDALAETTGTGSQQRRRSLLGELFSRATEAESDFLVRLFLGEMRTGALAGLVTDAVAQAARLPAKRLRRAVMLAGDLGVVAQAALTGGETALASIGLTLHRPVQPMLASTATSVAEAVDTLGLVSVEWKLDGIRIQVHRHHGEVRIWTRNLNEVTGRVPGVAAVVAGLPGESLVLDGELLGHVDAERPQAFQDTMSRFGRDDAESHAGSLTPRFFDILHHDGVDLIDRPLKERIEILEAVTGAYRIPGVVTDRVAAAEDVLTDALAHGHEGVMVKDAASVYDAGRRGKAWRKVKPVHTLDLVVLAVEWGHGRRQGLLSNLHLGARDGDGFVMVGKTFKGLTDELLAWQTDRFRELALRETPGTVWVRPEQVVEIALDGVHRSTRYPGGVALRFARVRGYRPDKAAEEADTLDAVRALLPEGRPQP